MEDEFRYYPDSLGLDETVVFSGKRLLDPWIYFVTNKRIFAENKLSKKKKELEFKKVVDIHIRQGFLGKKLDRGSIIIEHSNFKKNVPISRKKYFVIPQIKNPQEAYLNIKKEIEKHKSI